MSINLSIKNENGLITLSNGTIINSVSKTIFIPVNVQILSKALLKKTKSEMNRRLRMLSGSLNYHYQENDISKAELKEGKNEIKKLPYYDVSTLKIRDYKISDWTVDGFTGNIELVILASTLNSISETVFMIYETTAKIDIWTTQEANSDINLTAIEDILNYDCDDNFFFSDYNIELKQSKNMGDIEYFDDFHLITRTVENGEIAGTDYSSYPFFTTVKNIKTIKKIWKENLFYRM